MSIPLDIQATYMTQGEWPMFIATFALWTFGGAFGFAQVRRTVLSKTNDPCGNWLIAILWLIEMWLMWISMFYFWRQTDSSSSLYQAGLPMYFLCAVFTAPFPYYVAEGYRVLACITAWLSTATSITAVVLAFMMNNLGVSGFLTSIFAWSALAMAVWSMLAASDCCFGWPDNAKTHADAKKKKKSQSNPRARMLPNED